MAVRITDGTDQLAIDASGRAQVNPPTDVDAAGFVAIASQVDDGVAIGGARYMKALEASADYRLRVGSDTLLFNLSFEGTTVAQAHIQQNLVTLTAAQASGFLSLNSATNTAAGSANIRTYRTFPLFGTFQIYAEFWLREANETATNSVSEWGFGYVSGTSAPTDGVFFRRLAGGELRAVLNYNGVETTAVINTGLIAGYSATNVAHYVVAVHQDEVEFWVNDVLAAKIDVPGANPLPASSNAQPVFARVYNSATASAGRRVEVGYIHVSIGDMDTGKPWSHVMAGIGAGAYQNGPGSASGQTANWSNSAAPAVATLSNTAASYTTLGGQYQFAANATNETDWAMFAYQNPAGSATLPGRTLYVTGIRIGEMVVTGAATANATTFFWAAGAASTNVSLATTDGAATVGPRRVALGCQSFLAAAAVGTQAPGFQVTFDAPLVVPAGTLFHIILKQLNGTNTASLVWRGSVMVDGYFE